MKIGTDSKTFSDSFGYMTRHTLGTNFIVGPDNNLIRLYQLVCRNQTLGKLYSSSLKLEEIVDCGLFGKTHVVDVTPEDPKHFKFSIYAPKVRIAINDDMSGKTLISARWRALREFGLFDYQRNKEMAYPELSQVDIKAGHIIGVNRRLVVPIFSNGGKVSHLLVSIVMDQQEIVPNTIQ